MSDRNSEDKKEPKAARGATLYSGNTSPAKKREWKKNIKDAKFNTPVDYNKPEDLQFEKQLITYLGTSGIEVGSYKDRYILRRLRVRMGRLKFSSYRDYLDYIRKHPKELTEIQESLSINVTRFFRNRDTYEAVKKDIIPRILKEKDSIKIWSAGCAVGAEPYSIAMILSDIVIPSINTSILATDVKEELLRTARFGVYSEPYLAEMKDTEIIKYFSQTANGDYKIKPHIKKIVTFRRQDLMKDDFPRNVDLIFCRNVLIYVDRQAQNVILNKFFEGLKPGGYLVLGRTETLFGDWRKSVNVISTKHRIYQKKKLGVFEEIKFTEPVKPVKPVERTKANERGSRIVPKREITNAERLQELKDFRKTFEERKKMWEERMERNRIAREERIRSIRRPSTTASSSEISKTRKTFKQIKKRMEETSEETGSLSDYRKLLKKSREPTRESRIRRDRKQS